MDLESAWSPTASCYLSLSADLEFFEFFETFYVLLNDLEFCMLFELSCSLMLTSWVEDGSWTSA